MTPTTHAGTPYRPDRHALVGLAWRVALVVVAALAVALEAPPWLRLPLSAAALAVVALVYAARMRRRGVLDTGLVVTGAAIVVLILLGLLLNLLPAGLSAGGWALGVAVVQVVVLVALTLTRAPAARPAARRRPRASTIGWALAVVVVLTGAVVWSAVDFGATHEAPLAMEAEPDGTSTRVTVSAGSDEGPFQLQLVTDDGRTVLAADLRVGPDHPVTTTVELPRDSRALVQLVRQGGSSPLRELILDTTESRSGS